MNENTNEIKRLIGKCLNNWYWFSLCFAIALAAAWYLYVQEQIIYQVTGSIVVNEEKQTGGTQMAEEAMITGLPFNSRGSLNRQIEILRSRYLMEKVVDSLDLDISYNAEGDYKTEELYKCSPVYVSFVDDLHKVRGTQVRVKQLDGSKFKMFLEDGDTLIYDFGKPFQVGEASVVIENDTLVPIDPRVISISFNEPVALSAYYASQLVLQKISQSNVLSISMKDPTPKKVVDIIHQLIEEYNLDAQSEKNRLAQKSLDFISDRLGMVAKELRQEEGRQASIRSSNEVASGIDNSAERYFDKLSDVEASRSQLGNVKVTLDNIESFLNDPSNKDELIPNYGDKGTIAFTPLISQYNRTAAERRKLLSTATEAHPSVIKTTAEMTELKRNIKNAVRIAKNDLSGQEEKLVAELNPVQRKVEALPFVGRQLKDIERSADVRGDLFSYLLKKREETAIGLAANVESIRMLDVPVIGKTPVGPSKKQYLIFALLFGLGLPAGLIYSMDKLNTKIGDKEEVKSMIGDVPFLGELAKMKSARSKLVTDGSHTALSEMFRLVRTNLQFISSNDKQKTILVSSYISGDGKTFVSGNIAASLALTNKKTIVLELDLRRPKLAELMVNDPNRLGITNYMLGDTKVKDIIHKIDGVENLYLIPSGPTPPNPAELLMDERLDELINKLKEEYDYVVLDTPPVSLVTDAFLLNRFATNSILVIHSGKTKRSELEYLTDLCKEGKLTKPAIVLNGVKPPKRYGYYYYK